LSDAIVITGAREHNLKDVSLSLPRDRFIVITGLSGSGKSSLAFDTNLRRRPASGTSSRCRPTPASSSARWTSPTSTASKGSRRPSRSTRRPLRATRVPTVGTATEIYDYLRLLYARVGHPHCPNCGRPIEGQSLEQIIDQVLELETDVRFSVMSPVVRGRKASTDRLLRELRDDGFTRVQVDGQCAASTKSSSSTRSSSTISQWSSTGWS